MDQATLGMKYVDVVKHMEEGKGLAFIFSFTAVIQMLIPLNSNIKIQILICYLYTFSIEVVGRIR